MFFLNRGSKRQMIKKVPVYHEKTFKKINKYKKKNLEKLKPPKKSAFLWEKNSYCYVYSFLELKCAAHSPIHPSIHPSPSPPKPMTETVVGQLAHSCMRQRRPPPQLPVSHVVREEGKPVLKGVLDATWIQNTQIHKLFKYTTYWTNFNGFWLQA